MVEQALDAAHARAVLYGTLQGAHAAAATHPAGRKHPRASALWAAAPTTVLTLGGVYAYIFIASAAWHSQQSPGLIVQGFQLL